MAISALADEPAAFFVPQAPIASNDALSGYLQISISEDGHLSIRGTRLLLDWLLHELAANGWHVELDEIRWCG